MASHKETSMVERVEAATAGQLLRCRCYSALWPVSYLALFGLFAALVT